MPSRGKRGDSRGGNRGRGRGGRGRGSIGSGGRGRNRELIPSAIGYVYRPRSNVDDEDDFRVYGQFSSDEEDSDIGFSSPNSKKKSNNKKKTAAKKNTLGFVRETRPSFGSNYDDHYDDAMDRAGLGLYSSSSPAAANDSNTEDRFAKGKSKYFKTVLFTKSSSSLDLSKVNEKVVIQKTVVQQSATTAAAEPVTVEESLSKLTMNDFVKNDEDEKEVAKPELLSMLKFNNRGSANSSIATYSPVEIIDYADMEVVSKTSTPNKLEVKKSKGINDDEEGEVTKEEAEEVEESEEDTDEAEELISDEESDDEEAELFYDGEDTEDEDELLEDDMAVMEDYLENIELEEGEDLNDLLAWSAMQEGNFEVELEPSDDEEDRYDYASLDQEPTGKTLSDFEEEEAAIVAAEKKKKKSVVVVDESTRKKTSHKTRVGDTIVDPQIFGQTLKAALADVPAGLRPGMRRWYEKQQRKEDRQKKKEEAKAHRREKKKNGKGKQKDFDEAELSNQMLKIDERIREFILDESITSFQFAPMDTHVRRQLHVLATAYNLKSRSVGTGGSRSTIVSKTTTTYIPNDRRYISRFLSDIQTNIDEQNRIIGKNRSKGAPLQQKGKKKLINMKNKSNSGNSTPKDKRGDKQFPAGPSHGTVVAQDAAPIGESNVGHRMLAAMGWKQGEALGSKSDGIVAPIEAIIRKKGRGLGS